MLVLSLLLMLTFCLTCLASSKVSRHRGSRKQYCLVWTVPRSPRTHQLKLQPENPTFGGGPRPPQWEGDTLLTLLPSFTMEGVTDSPTPTFFFSGWFLCKLFAGSQAFSCCASILWNSLPFALYICGLDSVATFLKHLTPLRVRLSRHPAAR